MEYVVQMENIHKSFDGVYALKDVSISVKHGEIRAVVGENGAGKSTLMKILSGAITRDSGTIKFEGKAIKENSPRISKEHGISVIYQEFVLAPHLTVAENIFIDKLTRKSIVIDWKNLRKEAKRLLSELGFEDIDPDTKVAELSIAYQQVVEVCKALTRDAKLLVLDEPTAVLTFTEIEKLFELIVQLKKKNIGIIYISHRLDEIYELCDTITVLKDGTFVSEHLVQDISKGELINKMVGREFSILFPERNAEIGDVILEVNHLNVGKNVKDVSFKVRKGEVVGFSGLVGSGRTETMRGIFGADRPASIEMFFKGKNVHFKTPFEAVKNGFGLLPEDRKQQGVLLNMSIRLNTTLTILGKISKFGIINKKKEKDCSNTILKRLKTKLGTIEDDVSSLSGGNQQKVALAKWLAAGCECIVLDEPTRGVDVGAKSEIYKCINELAETGIAIIIISSEMEEIINFCDRALVMRNGTIVGEVCKEDLSEQTLIKMIMGV